MRRELAALVAGALLAGAAAWHLKPAPPPGPPDVVVDTVYAEQARPQLARPSLGTKLTTASVRPAQTLVASAPSGAGQIAVRRYCDPPPVVEIHPMGERVKSDSGADIQKPSASVLPDFAGRRDGPLLTLFSTLSDGRRWSAVYTVRGRATWQSAGAGALVRGDRLWVRVARGAARCAPPIGGSGLVGFVADRDQPLRGLALGAGAAALGCLF